MSEHEPMQEAEFDRFAEAYRAQLSGVISASGEPADFFAEYKVRDIAGVVAAQGMPSKGLTILDFGAGIGNSVPFFRKHLPGCEITCTDVSKKSLALGKARFGADAAFVHAEGGDLPFPDAAFDIILVACVLHHIGHAEHAAVLGSLRRRLTARGRLFIFEHNPLNPLTVRAVNNCAFDENARLMTSWSLAKTLATAGYSAIDTRYRIFFPGSMRKWRFLERYLRWCPLGAQYCLIARR